MMESAHVSYTTGVLVGETTIPPMLTFCARSRTKLGSNFMIKAKYVQNGKYIVRDSCESRAAMIAFTTVTGASEGMRNR